MAVDDDDLASFLKSRRNIGYFIASGIDPSEIIASDIDPCKIEFIDKEEARTSQKS